MLFGTFLIGRFTYGYGGDLSKADQHGRGEVLGQYRMGLLCLFPSNIISSRGGRWDFDIAGLNDVFREEMQRADFTIAGNPDNMFEDSNEDSDGKGQVVGMTVSGRPDAPMVNFFIPIAEAQSFLGLQLLPAK